MTPATTRPRSALPILVALSSCVMEVRVGDDLPEIPLPDPTPIDLDQDGYSFPDDCDDDDPRLGPADDPTFAERCDGLDNDCSGEVDVTDGGLEACAREARFVQHLSLDLLIVVDRSPINEPARVRAAEATRHLLEPLVGPAFDTHVGVITTDLAAADHAGRLVHPADADGPWADRFWVEGRTDSLTAATTFVASAIAESGVQLGGEEGGRAAVTRAMSESTVDTNRGFFRRGVPLALLFVSAEEDASETPDVATFVDALAERTDSYRAHAIVQTSTFGCDGKVSGTEGASYQDLALLTNGLTGSVCDLDFGPFLSAVGQYSAIQGLGDRFPLGEAAEGDSLEVVLTLPGGLRHPLSPDEFGLTDADRTLVILTDPLPPAGTEIAVRYLRTP